MKNVKSMSKVRGRDYLNNGGRLYVSTRGVSYSKKLAEDIGLEAVVNMVATGNVPDDYSEELMGNMLNEALGMKAGRVGFVEQKRHTGKDGEVFAEPIIILSGLIFRDQVCLNRYMISNKRLYRGTEPMVSLSN